jgi:hypothetical protein
MRNYLRLALIFVGTCLATQAQWLNQPIAGAPRSPDGTVNMKGPVPRLNGKADLSGLWQAKGTPRAPGGLFGLGEYENSPHFRDILADFKPNERPLTPEGAERLRKNSAVGLQGAPSVNCLPDGVPHGDLLPEPFKIIQTPGVIAMLYEVETTFRQVFTDGRKQLEDPSPSWNGYSVGQWEGDTLVVDTVGFNDLSWLDARGHGHSTEMRVGERFRRVDFGHLELTITITDPKTFTKPIQFTETLELMPDTDLFEHYCLENEKDGSPNKVSR